MPKTKKTTVRKTAQKNSQVRSAKLNGSYKKYLSRRNVIILLAIIIIAVLIYFFKGLFIAATVNGQPITRLELIQKLEKQSGKATLQSLITRDLILQEMKKKNITVTDAEVNSEIKKDEDILKKQGRTLEEALPTIGIGSREEFVERTRIELMLRKLFTKESAVSDDEVNKYMEQNKDTLPQGQDEKTIRETVKNQLRQQKLNGVVQNWLANLQKNAKINYFVSF